MLPDMDYLEASRVVCGKVCMFDPLTQSKIFIFTVISFAILMLTLCYGLMIRMSFIQDPGEVLRQTSTDILSIEEFAFYIYQTCHFSCCSLQCIPADKQTT